HPPATSPSPNIPHIGRRLYQDAGMANGRATVKSSRISVHSAAPAKRKSAPTVSRAVGLSGDDILPIVAEFARIPQGSVSPGCQAARRRNPPTPTSPATTVQTTALDGSGTLRSVIVKLAVG